MLLAIYPVVELTRLIVVSGNFYFPDMKGWFVFEITSMWIFYLSIIPVYLLFTQPSFNLKRKKVNSGHVKEETP
jgi:hypothetical protein